jgi:hypothetical protein
MNDAEREFASLQMTAGRDALFQALRGVSAVQSNFKPASDRWSIAECVEHVALTEEVLLKMLVSGAAHPIGVSLTPDKDGRMAAAVVDRSRRFQAPDVIRPSGRFASLSAAWEQFEKSRRVSVAYARECPNDLRGLFTMHPLLGQIDCYRCLLLLALHPARHAAQIEEIKQHPGYPKE